MRCSTTAFLSLEVSLPHSLKRSNERRSELQVCIDNEWPYKKLDLSRLLLSPGVKSEREVVRRANALLDTSAAHFVEPEVWSSNRIG